MGGQGGVGMLVDRGVLQYEYKGRMGGGFRGAGGRGGMGLISVR